MPANEVTWRNQQTMHVVFGITSLVMLLGTIWMLAADHRREWKQYQRKFRRVETWMTQARIDEQKTADFQARQRALEAALADAKKQVPEKSLVDEFVAAVEAHDENAKTAPIDEAYQRLSDKPSAEARAQLLALMRAQADEAKRLETNLLRDMKFRRADLDVDRSSFDRAVGESAGAAAEASAQEKVSQVQAEVDALNLRVQDAKTYRLGLEAILARITELETAAKKALDDHGAELARLHTAFEENRLSPGEQLLTMPILDAFGRPLSVDQIWLPNLTINYNFSDVARFDRCTTCHRAMDKTAPGSATIAAYPQANEIDVELVTPETDPRTVAVSEESAGAESGDSAEGGADGGEVAAADGADGASPAATETRSPAKKPQSKIEWIDEIYGLRLAARGYEPTEVTVGIVRPGSPAAIAKIGQGDVLVSISGVRLDKQDLEINRQLAIENLLERVVWGKPVALRVRRGIAHPYSSHPRLDLFVGPLSPHKMADVGCTICHDGQGSATQFKWASHTPNDPKQRQDWERDHGWFNNHHWIFPMNPKRFVESSCLKCHHDVVELEPSAKFADPPAPKLVEGYNLIREYGCFGCHEINGYNGPDKRVGPDLRVEPPIFAAASQVLADPALTPEVRDLALKTASDPEDTATRKLLAELIRADQAKGATYDSDTPPAFAQATHRMAGILGADYEAPGTFRKVGPSLRHLASKNDFNFVYNWIRDPADFRPSTKMPKFFGHWDHLVPEPALDANGHPQMETVEEHGQMVERPKMVESPGLAESKRFEPVEIFATAHYLLSASQSFEFLEPYPGVTEAPSVERGKNVFQLRGCLACHSHADFPEGKANQGPDLSRLGSKLATENGRRWLYSWVREPNRYHLRTVMPNVFLEPITSADGTVTDPAADVTEYLLSSQGWDAPAVPALVEADLDALALTHLSATFTARQSQEYLERGIPESRAAELKGDEVVLVGEGQMSVDKKLRYVGRRTISKFGCAGCHDIPGFEDSKPIGTALADWGRKDPSKLAFEAIGRYLHEAHGTHGGEPAHDNPHADGQAEEDTSYFMEALAGHQREGFLWQKLRAPRSYDYRKTSNKPYNDRLRMPKFPFDQSQIEAVMTFVLGLVSEPPRAQYIYTPDARGRALVEGRKALDKYNCGGCHQLEMERWQFDYDPNTFEPPPEVVDYHFVLPHFPPEALAASKQTDRRGLGTATIIGRPDLDAEGLPLELTDDDDRPAALFNLWKSTSINGEVWSSGVDRLLLTLSQVSGKWPGRGGDLARLIYPAVFAEEKANNPNAKESDAWGWVPPPLLNEGLKVQTDWLHDFLLNPYPIRPAVVLRMPKFNLSSTEASALVNYFAAVDGVEYPYAYDSRTASSHLAQEEAAHPNRMQDALKLMTNRNYCVQCHLLGDFVPEGSVKAQAPQLDQVYRRLRPSFVRRWIANPKRLLPYTGMPVNFPVDKPAAPELYPGTAEEQVDAVTDLLLNWDLFTKNQVTIKDKVPPPAAAGEGAAAPSAAGGQEHRMTERMCPTGRETSAMTEQTPRSNHRVWLKLAAGALATTWGWSLVGCGGAPSEPPPEAQGLEDTAPPAVNLGPSDATAPQNPPGESDASATSSPNAETVPTQPGNTP